MTEKTAPVNKPFEIEDWLQDAKLPHESVDVYKAGELPAEAKTIQRELTIERALENIERTSADVSRFAELERRYIQVTGAWAASKITIYVSAIPPEKMRELREEHDAKHEDMIDKALANELFGYTVLANAIVGVAETGVEYTDENGAPAMYGPVAWTETTVRGMAKKLGPAQMSLIVEARQTAQNALPTVDADFLHKNYGEGTKNTGR